MDFPHMQPGATAVPGTTDTAGATSSWTFQVTERDIRRFRQAIGEPPGETAPPLFYQGFGETDLVVGLCGVMRPEKAHGDFLRALAQRVQGADTARGGQRVCGWLIGDGPLRAALERDIDALGLRERVRISGFVQDVRPLVAACDAMAITSTTETFSLAALEAMALGKPLLMTDVGGAREQVRHGHNGWLVPVGDVQAMAGALARWLDPAAREAMGRRAAAEVRERFGLAAMVHGFERQFNALV